MNEITVSAHAKINWSLDIVGRRADGYHLLDMLMQPVSLSDRLTIRKSSRLSFRTEGAKLSCPGENLVLQAARKLQPYAAGQGAEITLFKQIPSGAGLGGGSADAACALKALRSFWSLPLTDDELARIGLSLGADVPFCLLDAPARVQGIGEIVTPLFFRGSVSLLIVKPEQSLSTPAVFRAYDLSPDGIPSDPDDAVSALTAGDYPSLRDHARNALYGAALRLLPGLGEILSALYRSGAQFAAMSGSGSACFGVFENQKSAAEARSALEKSLRLVTVYEAHTLPEDGEEWISAQ